MNTLRHYSLKDRLCLSVDLALRALSGNVKTTGAPYPADHIETAALLTPQQTKQAASLMRVNHTGEICAQALYHGQSIVSRHSSIQEKLARATIEEGDHLTWCKKRLDELESHPSYLNSLWYSGSFCIGLVAGMIGDEWSLGFVAETEKQVVAHLKKHIDLLPDSDQRSIAILKQMEQDESAHRHAAINLGARELPLPIKTAMKWASKVMVKISYWI